MRILKNKSFDHWAKEIGLSDSSLLDVAYEMQQGLYEANLGGNVYKKRISIGNRGKSGGARTILAFKMGGNIFFMYGFAKNKRDNITDKEVVALKMLAKVYLAYDDKQINHAVRVKQFIEVTS